MKICIIRFKEFPIKSYNKRFIGGGGAPRIQVVRVNSLRLFSFDLVLIAVLLGPFSSLFYHYLKVWIIR